MSIATRVGIISELRRDNVGMVSLFGKGKMDRHKRERRDPCVDACWMESDGSSMVRRDGAIIKHACWLRKVRDSLCEVN